jgi:hypothetical protein
MYNWRYFFPRGKSPNQNMCIDQFEQSGKMRLGFGHRKSFHIASIAYLVKLTNKAFQQLQKNETIKK